ncbi:tapasin-related protein isoform X1 [Latimeria chalumnae]|nr:PREDICTED: tapasin-related protein isoform X2 [Latimeria chalumnae]|eukprot:XP_014351927.1 PREDICTED: tapasin-related protein isoform X2 [Latimeria chalumnae]
MKTGFLCLLLFCSGLVDGNPLNSKRGVDIVLDCFYVSEAGGRLGGFTSSFTREPATLVLRNVSMTDDPSLEGFTDYKPNLEEEEQMVFEVLVSTVEIPEAESILHADCNGQEVICEVSQYFLQKEEGPESDAPPSQANWFISSLQIAGGGISVTMVMKNMATESSGTPQKHKKLGVPITNSGTILTSAEFNVYTHTPSIFTPLGRNVTMDCKFTGVPGLSGVAVEWRLQHQGSGRRIFQYRDAQGIPDRLGAWMDVDSVESQWDATLTVSDFQVQDEGTYICTVSSGGFHAQQTLQVMVMESPRVKLTPNTLVWGNNLPTKVTCEMAHYYPLDVTVEWLLEAPGANSEPTTLSNVYFSSHRQNKDGTFNITSYIWISPVADHLGTTYTCQVTHASLSKPIRASLTVKAPEPSGSWMIWGISLSTCIFIAAAFTMMCSRRNASGFSTDPKNGNIKKEKVLFVFFTI